MRARFTHVTMPELVRLPHSHDMAAFGFAATRIALALCDAFAVFARATVTVK